MPPTLTADTWRLALHAQFLVIAAFQQTSLPARVVANVVDREVTEMADRIEAELATFEAIEAARRAAASRGARTARRS